MDDQISLDQFIRISGRDFGRLAFRIRPFKIGLPLRKFYLAGSEFNSANEVYPCIYCF